MNGEEDQGRLLGDTCAETQTETGESPVIPGKSVPSRGDSDCTESAAGGGEVSTGHRGEERAVMGWPQGGGLRACEGWR